MRREQTAAIARAVSRLVDDRRLWLVDAGALAFTGLDGIPHGFEHPARYELAMTLRPGDAPPRALELTRALGMTAPSLAPTDWPELVRVVDSDWAARHPAVDLEVAVKTAGRALSSDDALWGPIRVDRRDIEGSSVAAPASCAPRPRSSSTSTAMGGSWCACSSSPEATRSGCGP